MRTPVLKFGGLTLQGQLRFGPDEDRLMEEWGRQFPQYGFAQHKGYGTAEHLACIARYGPSPIHRRTFAGVREHTVQGSLW